MREAEIADPIRTRLLQHEFIALMLDCEKCSSMWAGLLCSGLAMVCILIAEIKVMYSMPVLFILLALASAAYSVKK
jgi:hypothetical protein